MTNVHLVGGLDIAELTFFTFFLFFLGLVWYLRGISPQCDTSRSVAMPRQASAYP